MVLNYLLGKPGPVTGYGSATTAAQVAADNAERIKGRVFIVTGSSAGLV